jgi:Fe-S-cluster containining protein
MTMSAFAFGEWLAALGPALRGDADSDVPCGTCIACCSSSQFVHIEPDELGALAHIPAELLFPAPRLPKGHVLMGYDERGRCPMLTDAGCSIYEHRPRTCRTYDCRVFPATGVFPDEPEKSGIAERARAWQVTYCAPAERALHEALLATTARLRAAEGDLPATPLAVRACRLFTADDR